MAHQVDAAFRLVGQLDEREPRARAGRIHVVDRAVEVSNGRRFDAGASQPRERGLLVVDGERQNVDAGIACQETIQRGAACVRIDDREQLHIRPMQHRAAVADTAIGLAGERCQREPEALVLRGQRGKIARDDADVVERDAAHLAFS